MVRYVAFRQSACPVRSSAEEKRKADSVNRSLATLNSVITWLGISEKLYLQYLASRAWY